MQDAPHAPSWNGLLILSVASLLIASGTAAARDFFVTTRGSDTSCDQASPCSLATAIGEVDSGDTIYVGAGTYTATGSSVVTLTSGVSLLGGWDGSGTGAVVRDPSTYASILDGENARRVVTISGGASPTVDGFTITRGNASGLTTGCHGSSSTPNGCGGGIFVDHGGATISNNVISSCVASTGANTEVDSYTGYGGGLALMYADGAVISGNTIVGNVAASGTTGLGGGILLFQCAGTTRVEDNRVVRNAASTSSYGWGDGLAVNAGRAAIKGNTVQANLKSVGWEEGNGIYVWCADGEIEDNLISAEEGAEAVFLGFFGGGFQRNRVFADGAAEALDLDCGSLSSDAATVVNNFLTGGSRATLSATGCDGNPVTGSVLHNTIVGNESATGAYFGTNVDLTFTDNIVTSSATGIEVAGPGASVSADHNLFWNNASNGTRGTDPVDGDPRFVDAASGDFHITAGSAALDAGIDAGVTSDFDAEARPAGSAPDIGADELGCTIACSASGPASGEPGSPGAFHASATPSASCSGSASYDWVFGDPAGASSQQNPSHGYATEGVFPWLMTASAGGVTCTATGRTAVSVPAVAPIVLHQSGLHSSQWSSDLKLYNPSDETISGVMTLTPRSTSLSAGNPTLAYSIPAHWVSSWSDLYGVVHGGGTGADRLLVMRDASSSGAALSAMPVAENVMKSELAGGGEYSQCPTTFPTSGLYPAGTVLAAILGSTGERDSVYVMTGHQGATIQFTFRLAGGGGAVVVTKSYGRDKTFQHTAGIKEILGYDPAADQSLEATITSGSAWIAITHINNATNAPRWFDMVPTSTASPGNGGKAIVPLMIHLAGLYDSQWRGDLKLYNPNAGAISGTFTFTPRSASQSGNNPTMAFSVPARRVVVYEDIYASAHPGGSGADRVLITMDDDPGTGGPYALPVAEAVMRSVLSGGGEYSMCERVLSSDALPSAGSRFAAILGSAGERDSVYVVSGPSGVTLEYTYRDSTGGNEVTFSRSYGRDKTFQYTSGVKELLGFDPGVDASLEATITAGSGWVVLTHTNNVTNSPRWYDFAKLP
jgi:Right handed beta helix region/PKD domain